MDNASARRDRVNLFKKIYGWVRIGIMALASVSTVILFCWLDFEKFATSKKREISTQKWLEYIQDDRYKNTVIASAVCTVIATCFVVFLVMQGIQMLVVKFMMRHANI